MVPTDSITDENVTVEKLSAECPTHGMVPVVCPRCAGKVGGKAHRGTRSRRNKQLKALADARRVLDVYPEAKMLEEMASERKEFQDLADKIGLTNGEHELLLTRLRLDSGMDYLKHICDRIGMSPVERARLREDMQRSVALALSSPDEVMATLDRRRRKE
jgi:hypothetical protein